MKILVASSTFYPTNVVNVGGIEQVSYSLFQDLNQYEGVTCDLLTTADSSLKDPHVIFEATLSKYALSGVSNVARSYDSKTMSTLRDRSYNFIVCNTTSTSRLEQLLSLGPPVLLAIHQGPSFRNDIERFSKYQQLKSQYSHLRISTVSRHCKSQIEKEVPHLIDYITHPVSEEVPPELPMTHRSGFVFIGRLGKSKNLDLALKIFDGYDEHLTVIGSVPSNPSSDLEHYRANQEKVLLSSSNISYLGIKGREDIYKHLSSAKALLITANNVSFDLVGIEALRVGTPLVYLKKRTSGPDEYITNGLNGYGVDTFNKREKFVIDIVRDCLDSCHFLTPEQVKESYRSLHLTTLNEFVLRSTSESMHRIGR